MTDVLGVETKEGRGLHGEIALLHLKIDELKLEMIFQKADRNWEKGVEEYIEDAVAAEYGIDKRQFYTLIPRGRRKNADSNLIQARYMLYTLLHCLLCKTLRSIADNYQLDARNYANRWTPIFGQLHRSRPASPGKSQQEYDTYFPRLEGAYRRLKEDLVSAGKWEEVFSLELFES